MLILTHTRFDTYIMAEASHSAHQALPQHSCNNAQQTSRSAQRAASAGIIAERTYRVDASHAGGSCCCGTLLQSGQHPKNGERGPCHFPRSARWVPGMVPDLPLANRE